MYLGTNGCYLTMFAFGKSKSPQPPQQFELCSHGPVLTGKVGAPEPQLLSGHCFTWASIPVGCEHWNRITTFLKSVPLP